MLKSLWLTLTLLAMGLIPVIMRAKQAGKPVGRTTFVNNLRTAGKVTKIRRVLRPEKFVKLACVLQKADPVSNRAELLFPSKL